MDCPNCQYFDEEFDRENAIQDIESYRSAGPRKNTQILLDALGKEKLERLTHLDIGGGVGVIQNELLKMGVRTAMSVEGSDTYAEMAQEEAKRQGHSQMISYKFGDFVEISDQIPRADIVTLDSVLCCYIDMVSLVSLSIAHAEKLYGIIYPRDNLWGKATVARWNVQHWLRGKKYRDYSHSTAKVDGLVQSLGMRPHFHWRSRVWQVVVYIR